MTSRIQLTSAGDDSRTVPTNFDGVIEDRYNEWSSV